MTGHELRCDNRMHARFLPPETVEVKCDSRWCGAIPGHVVVLHRFNVRTQETTTIRFQPVDGKKVKNATHRRPAAVRNS
jgi:hypothetical protein